MSRSAWQIINISREAIEKNAVVKGACIYTFKKRRSKYTSSMKLAPNCVVSLRTKSEKKLHLDNILLFLLFEIARTYNLFNMTAFSCENPKHRNTEYRSTEGPTLRRVKTPKSHDTSYPSLRQNIISYCCRVMSYWYIISHWYII